MIVANNIRKETHLADFRCDVCGGVKADSNVNSDTSYPPGTVNIIKVDGSILTPTCACETFYPTNDEQGNPMGYALGQAKTS